MSSAEPGPHPDSRDALDVNSPIGRLHHLVIDCPHPTELAQFYSALLGLPVTYSSEDWVVIAESDTTSGIAFQIAPDHQPPEWPNPDRPQQMHLDVMVDDLAAAERRAIALGARRLQNVGGDSLVYAGPAGHPFCLIPRPEWAPPIDTRECGMGGRSDSERT